VSHKMTHSPLYCQSQGQRLSLFLYTHNTRASYFPFI
jgi:hypothetical protein